MRIKSQPAGKERKEKPREEDGAMLTSGIRWLCVESQTESVRVFVAALLQPQARPTVPCREHTLMATLVPGTSLLAPSFS